MGHDSSSMNMIHKNVHAQGHPIGQQGQRPEAFLTRTHTHTHTQIYTYVHTHTHSHTRTHTRAHTRTHSNSQKRAHTRACKGHHAAEWHSAAPPEQVRDYLSTKPGTWQSLCTVHSLRCPNRFSPGPLVAVRTAFFRTGGQGASLKQRRAPRPSKVLQREPLHGLWGARAR